MNYELVRPGMPTRVAPPALPPRAARGPAPQVPPRHDLELERADWYWGNISREQVSEKLDGQPDGTFLVRDSYTASGEYTLCVRKGGNNRLIRIYRRRGRFGFSEPCQFDSVVKLIDCYRRESLRDYNVLLDVRLERPLVESRQFGSRRTASIIEELRKLLDKYTVVVDEMERLERRSSALAASIIIHKKAQEAYQEVCLMFHQQVKIANHIKAELHERDKVQDNKRRLEIRMEKVQQRQQQVEQETHQQTVVLKTIERDLGAVHQEEHQLIESTRHLERELQRRGISGEQLEKLLKGGGADCTPLSEQEDLWLLENCNRPRAEAVLRDKPDGTFLIRRCQDQHDMYVLSICALGQVEHCKIFRSERGYGFSRPYAIHSSLRSLVDYYHSESELSDFNERLPKSLMYPAIMSSRVG